MLTDSSHQHSADLLEVVPACKGADVLAGAGALTSEYQAELQPAKRRRTAHLDASFPAAASSGNFPHPATITFDKAFPTDQSQVGADLLCEQSYISGGLDRRSSF